MWVMPHQRPISTTTGIPPVSWGGYGPWPGTLSKRIHPPRQGLGRNQNSGIDLTVINRMENITEIAAQPYKEIPSYTDPKTGHTRQITIRRVPGTFTSYGTGEPAVYTPDE